MSQGERRIHTLLQGNKLTKFSGGGLWFHVNSAAKNTMLDLSPSGLREQMG